MQRLPTPALPAARPWWALAAILLIFLSHGLVHVLAIGPERALDEPRHAAYALILVEEGRIPRTDEPMPVERMGIRPLRRSNFVAAANHPPLYYAIVGLPLKWGLDLGGGLLAGLIPARILTLLMGAGGLVYAWRALGLLFPRRPAIPLASVALVAMVPAVVNVSALLHNDALAFLTATACLEAAMRMAIRGPTAGRLAEVALWGSLAALTRFTGLILVAPAISLAAWAFVLHGEGGRSWLRAVGVFAGLCAALVLTSGWFYGLNLARYGDVTGGSSLLQALERPRHEPTWQLLLMPATWDVLYRDLWIRLAGGVRLQSTLARLALVPLGAAALGWLWLAVRRGGRLPQALRAARWRAPRPWVWACLIGAVSLVVLALLEFHHRGGTLSPRYGFPALWVVAVAVTGGWAALSRRWAPSVGLVLWAVLAMSCTVVYLGVLGRCRGSGWSCATRVLTQEGPWLIPLMLAYGAGVLWAAWQVAGDALGRAAAPSTQPVAEDPADAL